MNQNQSDIDGVMDVAPDAPVENDTVAPPDDATYIKGGDLVKDQSTLPAGLPFAQSWEMENSGATDWGNGYELVWVGGEQIGAPAAVPVPATVPGQSVRIVVPFTTPEQPGSYKSIWQLHNANGEPFGQKVWTAINVVSPADFVTMSGAVRRDAAFNGVDKPAGMARSPIPPSPIPGRPLSEADPELYAAWRDHIQRGFENNQVMFEQVLTGFMNPYWTTVWMYRTLFGVGLGAFVVAAILAFQGRDVATITFGGLSIASFLTYFFNRPLRAMEENLQFITWLGIIYNSYWTRLAYTTDLETVQTELEDVTNDAIAKMSELVDKHAERSEQRPMLGA